MKEMQLRQHLFGKKWGDFRPSATTREQLLDLVSRATSEVAPQLKFVFVPQATFSNHIADGGETAEVDRWNDWLARSTRAADGGLVQGTRRAIGFFNGDCPIVCLWQDDRLAVLHAGYRCLIRELDDDRNIIEQALRHFDTTQVQACIGFGIGPCCWIPGYATKPEILDPERHAMRNEIRSCLSRTTSASPGGAGHVSVDLPELAKLLLLKAGVRPSCISVDQRCTCCWQEAGQSPYWSLTRAKTRGEVDGRNLALAWLDYGN